MSRKLVCIIMAAILAMVVCGCQRGVSDASGSSTAGDLTPVTGETGLVYDEKEIGGNAGLNSPGNARIDSKNRLVVYDNDNPGRFVVLDADGKPQSEIVCAFSGWLGTFDLDSQDNIYAVISEALPDNEISQKVCAIDSSGRITATFELGKYRTDVEPEKMPMVLDMAIGSNGNFYIATLTGIIVLDGKGKIIKKIGDNAMYSIDTDPDNNIVVISIDKGKRAVEMYDSSSGKSIWSSDISALAQKSKTSFSSGSQKVRYDNSAKTYVLWFQAESINMTAPAIS